MLKTAVLLQLYYTDCTVTSFENLIPLILQARKNQTNQNEGN